MSRAALLLLLLTLFDLCESMRVAASPSTKPIPAISLRQLERPGRAMRVRAAIGEEMNHVRATIGEEMNEEMNHVRAAIGEETNHVRATIGEVNDTSIFMERRAAPVSPSTESPG